MPSHLKSLFDAKAFLCEISVFALVLTFVSILSFSQSTWTTASWRRSVLISKNHICWTKSTKMSWSAQPHFWTFSENLRDAEAKTAQWFISKFLIASHGLFEILSLISHFQWLSIKWRSLFSSLQRKEPVSFILVLFVGTLFSISLILSHVLICSVTFKSISYVLICSTNRTAFHTVYSYVLLCCHYLGFAFTSFHLRPALTLVG